MISFAQYLLEEAESPHFKTAEDVVKHVEKHHPGVDLHFYDINHQHHAHLSMIDVPKHMQKQGIGSKIMKHISNYSDQSGRTVGLTPEHRGKGQPSKAKLQSFYKDFGFKHNKARNKDYRFSETMLRRPKS
jgi:GNAT superfamily N-acetyltransferase